MYLYILASVLQLFHGPFQSEFPTECDLVLPLSISSIFSFPKGYPVAAHVFFLVFPLLMFFPLFLPLHIVKTSRVTGITARILKAALPGGEWSASRPGQCHYPPSPPWRFSGTSWRLDGSQSLCRPFRDKSLASGPSYVHSYAVLQLCLVRSIVDKHR